MSERQDPATQRVFAEDIPLEPQLAAVLVGAGDRLEEIRRLSARVSLPEERFDLLIAALDELDRALSRVREANASLARIERRLADGYQVALRRLRDVDRDVNGDGT
jgi:hypothetical protein